MSATIAHKSPDGTVLASETSHYDKRDRRTARVAADNTADLFAYDPAGQVIAAAYAQAQGSAGVPPASSVGVPPSPDFKPQQTFAYDPAGNRKTHTDPDGSKTEYQANEANQYTQLATDLPTENGQRKTENATPVYDKNGNLLTDPSNTYTWDAYIHLLSVSNRGIPAPSPTAATGAKNAPTTPATAQAAATQFRYDSLHRRVARQAPGQSV